MPRELGKRMEQSRGKNKQIDDGFQVSMLPVAVLDIQKGHRCLDTCASPGSKTAQMLAMLANASWQAKAK